jgi:hypothetical protein
MSHRCRCNGRRRRKLPPGLGSSAVHGALMFGVWVPLREVALDRAGTVYVADTANHRIRKVS